MNACRWNKRGSRRWLRTTIVLLTAPLLVTALVLQPSALVVHPGTLSEQQRLQVEQLIVDNSPPRLQSSGYSEISLNAEELTLLGSFALEQMPALRDTAAHFDLSGPNIRLQLSQRLNLGPLQPHLNIDSQLAIVDNSLALRQLRTGWLAWPSALHPSLRRGAEALLIRYSIDYREILDMQQAVQDIRLQDEQLQASVHWQRNTLDDLRGQAQLWLVSDDDRQRLIHYYRLVQHQVADHNREGNRSLHSVMPAMFLSARQRSAGNVDQAVAENRSLLQALTLYVNQLDPALLIHDIPSDLKRAASRPRLTLSGRQDLSRHFVTSAAIAASAGATIAEVLANSKELHDARYSTGFSFSDVAANMAGITLGEQAVDKTTAQQVQQRVQQATAETDYMPSIAGLPDGLSEADFLERYGARDSTPYQQRLRDFDEQIRQLPTFR